MLITGVYLYLSDLAILDSVGRAGREDKLFTTDLPVTGVLLDDRPIVEFAEVDVIHPDPCLEQRAEESHYGIDAFHFA